MRRNRSRALCFTCSLLLSALLSALLGTTSCQAADDAKAVPEDHAARMKAGLALFQREVRPVLVAHCLECHGGKSTKADFDLSTRKKLLESGYVGEDAASSYLLDLVRHTAEPHMPFKSPKLPEKAVEQIARWIDLGAPYDKPLVDGAAIREPSSAVTEADRQFWSFRPLEPSAPPELPGDDWSRTPIDRFILAKLREAGLRPSAEADRRVLIRRVYFDLIGLPPTPEQVEAFVTDADPQAYERLVDELLESPHYGERWARHWMDVARFAESHGYEQDYDRPHAYHYRDFLIRALNADMPYDRFIRWQIAGDELAPGDPLAMCATGFLGAGAFPTQLTEMEFESARYDELDDMIATTGTAVLGLTIGCARCHDHKFDPIPTSDYYRLIATFATTIRSETELDLSGLPGGPAEPVKVQVNSEGLPHMKHHADGRGYPHFYPEVHHLQRGDVHQKVDVAEPGFLQVLMQGGQPVEHWSIQPPDGSRTSFRRAALANWLTDPEHGAGHLAARVIVNRLWHHHFGRGIVATPSDFGFQGERPTHPELLDWLAADLIENGWRLKRVHKLMVTSAVYRQGAEIRGQRSEVRSQQDDSSFRTPMRSDESPLATAHHSPLTTHSDPDNRLFARREPRRLEAEAIRDAMLAVSGLLDETMYGPGTLDPNMRRRSVYFFIKRSQLIPMMMLFDWPEHLVGIGRRSETTIAPQALAFLNSPQCRQYAEGFAGRLSAATAEEKIIEAYRIAFGRRPTEREVELSSAFLQRQSEHYQSAGRADADRMALIDFCQALLSANEFIYIQ